MTAAIITIVCLPLASRRFAKACIKGFHLIAVRAGKYSAVRTAAFPIFDSLGLPLTDRGNALKSLKKPSKKL